MKTAFYFVDETYINYLKDYEVKHRGFTTVPGVIYSNRKKFLYGAVLEIDKKKYLVPVSSYTKNQRENMLIKISDHHKNKVVGSLRFRQTKVESHTVPRADFPVGCVKNT